MYTKEQLMPKRYPEERPLKNSGYWCFDTSSDRWIHYYSSGGCFDGVHKLTRWFVDIPGAPEEVKPLAYPENKPSEGGMYITHNKVEDAWQEAHSLDAIHWVLLVDYFIPIRLIEILFCPFCGIKLETIIYRKYESED